MSKYGSLEFICGCMYSGKTEELQRRVRRAIIAKQKVLIFKSHRDSRYSEDKITTHSGESIEAVCISASKAQLYRSYSSEILTYLTDNVDVVAIDEIQFFDDMIVDVCNELIKRGIRVIVAGLLLDFRGEPFGNHVLNLLAISDEILKLNAICVYCGREATRTQRFVNGKPAKWSDPIYMVGGDDLYQAVCREHLIIEKPERPKKYHVYAHPKKKHRLPK